MLHCLQRLGRIGYLAARDSHRLRVRRGFLAAGPRAARFPPASATAGSSSATLISCAATHFSMSARRKRQSEPRRNAGILRFFKSLLDGGWMSVKVVGDLSDIHYFRNDRINWCS